MLYAFEVECAHWASQGFAVVHLQHPGHDEPRVFWQATLRQDAAARTWLDRDGPQALLTAGDV